MDLLFPLKFLISLTFLVLLVIVGYFVFKLVFAIAKAIDILFDVVNEWLLTKAALYIYDLKELRESTYKQIVFVDGKPVEKT